MANEIQETDGKGFWNRIGAAWRHKDGHGVEPALSSLPVNGRVTLRDMRDERMQGYEKKRGAQKQTPETRPGHDAYVNRLKGLEAQKMERRRSRFLRETA